MPLVKNPTNAFPEGYSVHSHDNHEKRIRVNMDFGHTNREAMESFTYQGKVWYAGELDILTQYESSRWCCARWYYLDKPSHPIY
jgi:hypothetical protein